MPPLSILEYPGTSSKTDVNVGNIGAYTRSQYENTRNRARLAVMSAALKQNAVVRDIIGRESLITRREGQLKQLDDQLAQYYGEFGSVLNAKALDFLNQMANVNVPTVTSILAGFENARASRADMEMKRITDMERLMNLDANLQKERMALRKEQIDAEQMVGQAQLKAMDEVYGGQSATNQEAFKMLPYSGTREANPRSQVLHAPNENVQVVYDRGGTTGARRGDAERVILREGTVMNPDASTTGQATQARFVPEGGFVLNEYFGNGKINNGQEEGIRTLTDLDDHIAGLRVKNQQHLGNQVVDDFDVLKQYGTDQDFAKLGQVLGWMRGNIAGSPQNGLRAHFLEAMGGNQNGQAERFLTGLDFNKREDVIEGLKIVYDKLVPHSKKVRNTNAGTAVAKEGAATNQTTSGSMIGIPENKQRQESGTQKTTPSTQENNKAQQPTAATAVEEANVAYSGPGMTTTNAYDQSTATGTPRAQNPAMNNLFRSQEEQDAVTAAIDAMLDADMPTLTAQATAEVTGTPDTVPKNTTGSEQETVGQQNARWFSQQMQDAFREAQQQPVQQEPVQQEPVQQEPVQQEPVQQEPVQQQPTESDRLRQMQGIMNIGEPISDVYFPTDEEFYAFDQSAPPDKYANVTLASNGIPSTPGGESRQQQGLGSGGRYYYRTQGFGDAPYLGTKLRGIGVRQNMSVSDVASIPDDEAIELVRRTDGVTLSGPEARDVIVGDAAITQQLSQYLTPDQLEEFRMYNAPDSSGHRRMRLADVRRVASALEQGYSPRGVLSGLDRRNLDKSTQAGPVLNSEAYSTGASTSTGDYTGISEDWATTPYESWATTPYERYGEGMIPQFDSSEEFESPEIDFQPEAQAQPETQAEEIPNITAGQYKFPVNPDADVYYEPEGTTAAEIEAQLNADRVPPTRIDIGPLQVERPWYDPSVSSTYQIGMDTSDVRAPIRVAAGRIPGDNRIVRLTDANGNFYDVPASMLRNQADGRFTQPRQQRHWSVLNNEDARLREAGGINLDRVNAIFDSMMGGMTPPNVYQPTQGTVPNTPYRAFEAGQLPTRIFDARDPSTRTPGEKPQNPVLQQVNPRAAAAGQAAYDAIIAQGGSEEEATAVGLQVMDSFDPNVGQILTASAYGNAMSDVPAGNQVYMTNAGLQRQAQAQLPPGAYNTYGNVKPSANIRTKSGVSLQGMNDELMNRMNRMAQILKDEFGMDLTISSGRRTQAEQAVFHRKGKNRAAAPGRSPHQHGNAFDVAIDSSMIPQFNRNQKARAAFNGNFNAFWNYVVNKAGLYRFDPVRDKFHHALPPGWNKGRSSSSRSRGQSYVNSTGSSVQGGQTNLRTNGNPPNTLGIRLNNPFNLKLVNGLRPGEISPNQRRDPGGHAIFDSLSSGVNAGARDIVYHKFIKRGINTIKDFVEFYLGNDPEGRPELYKRTLEKLTGWKRNQPIDVRNEEAMVHFLMAVLNAEGGTANYIGRENVRAAYRKVMNDSGVPVNTAQRRGGRTAPITREQLERDARRMPM